MAIESATILVVDDNPATRYSTSRVLRGAGWNVREAVSGEEACEKAAEDVDLVVLDVHLPDIDGYEVCRRLRQRTATARLPILHLSATFVTSEHKVHGLEAGADGYLTHPVEPPVLIATVHAFLRTRQAELESRENAARFKAVFENSLAGVTVFDESLTFVDANPTMARLLKTDRAGIVGHQLAEFIPPEWTQVIPLLTGLDRLQPWRGEFPLRTTDGELVYFDWHLSPYSHPGLCLASASDITFRIQYQQEREALLDRERTARAEAENANRLKDDFLATLSHELRTPLNAIVGWSHLLRIGRTSPAETAEGLEAIERNALAQARMISDLLDVSRIVSGKIRLDIQPLDPAAVFEAALVSVIPLAEGKSIRISRSFDSIVGSILGDPARLQQVLWNLVNNAVKFTPEHGAISVALTRNESHVEMTVTDNGQGIPAELLPQVFDRFRQGDSSSTREHSGLGLGLSISKQLVEMHGGQIRVESPGPGKGATFTVQIPLALPSVLDLSQPGNATGAEIQDDIDLSGLRVLVVEDDPDSRNMLRHLIENCGATTIAVNRTTEALAVIEQFSPQVLLSDIGLPGQDGFALIREIRARGYSFQDLPAIALTAFAGPEDRRRTLLAGFQVHLAKPIDPREVTVVIASLTGRAASGFTKNEAPDS